MSISESPEPGHMLGYTAKKNQGCRCESADLKIWRLLLRFFRWAQCNYKNAYKWKRETKEKERDDTIAIKSERCYVASCKDTGRSQEPGNVGSL